MIRPRECTREHAGLQSGLQEPAEQSEWSSWWRGYERYEVESLVGPKERAQGFLCRNEMKHYAYAYNVRMTSATVQ